MTESQAAAQRGAAPKTRAKSVDRVKPVESEPGSPDVEAPVADAALEHELDRLSLEQAVRDFEIANARVVDLTQRLISANEHIVELQRDRDAAAIALAGLQSHLTSVTNSAAFRMAEKFWGVRDLIWR